MNFAKFLGTPSLQNTSGRLFLKSFTDIGLISVLLCPAHAMFKFYLISILNKANLANSVNEILIKIHFDKSCHDNQVNTKNQWAYGWNCVDEFL